MPKEKKKVYTLSVAYMEEMLQECNEQISISKDLICDLITDETLPNNNSLLFPVTEILFCNLTMLYFIELEMGSYPPSTNKETGEDE